MNAMELATAAGIDDAMIASLVDRFYAAVREDSLLGPVFGAVVADWDVHLQRMRDFWASVVMAAGRYHGRPMPKHAPLPIDAQHFDRWVALFCETARKVCPPNAAAIFISRAENIARSLEMGVAVANGVVLGVDERYRRSGADKKDSGARTRLRTF